MAMEDADLKRRILAQRQILRELVAQLAQGRPGILSRMRRGASSAQSAVAGPAERHTPPLARAAGAPVVMRAAQRHGVWRVTQNDAFVGDYLTKAAAQSALSHAASEVAARGDRVAFA